MKNRLRGFLVVLAIIASAAFAWGEASPVHVDHILTGYSKGAATVTLTYIVQVQNRGERSVGPLSLSLVPHPPFITSKTTVTVETLAPKGRANLRVKVVTPLLREQKSFVDMPLLWAAKLTDADGKVVEFPVKSKQGGAK